MSKYSHSPEHGHSALTSNWFDKNSHAHEDNVFVIVSAEIVQHIESLKKNGLNSFIIYKLVDYALVKEDFIGTAETPKKIAEHLPKDECRYVVYNYAHSPHGHELLLINW